MGKPRLIILIRHGQSEGNKNRDIHQTVPDHRVKLTSEGWNQAYDAGRRLRAMLRADDTIQFFTSPYRRTRETTEGILQTLTSDESEPSPFKRNNIKVYEEPRLREQDFGNFQPCSAEMERMWQERADYGHFFYRIPDGESAADAYDRVSGFNESLWRQFGEDDFPSVCVLVTHGLMSRVFLMKWYHFSVEYFEDLRNVNHCEFMIMRKQNDSGKYKLESKLRTWSELRRERAAVLKQKEEDAAREASHDKDGKDKAVAGLSSPSSSNLVTRRWGGCPNGCNHDKNFKIRPGLADLIKRDGTNVYTSDGGSQRNSKSSSSLHGHNHSAHNSKSSTPTPPALGRRTTAARRFHSVGYSDDDDNDEADGDKRVSSPGSNMDDKNKNNTVGKTVGKSSTKDATGTANTTGTGAASGGHGSGLLPPQIDVSRAREEIVSSPDATPSFITPEDRLRSEISPPAAAKSFLHLGRDFGGTYSGHTSDADSSEDDHIRRRMARLKMSISGDTESSTSTHSHSHGSSEVRSSVAKTSSVLTQVDSDQGGTTITTMTTSASTTSIAGASGGTPTSMGSHVRRKRTKNMANRLGDAPYCSDCEHAEGELCMDECMDEMDVDDNVRLNKERGGGNEGDGGNEADDDDDQTDVDHDVAIAEKADRSITGSVY